MNDVTIWWSVVKSARRARGARTPSLIISDQICRPRRSHEPPKVASGMAPMPSCRVAPSGTRWAMCSPIWSFRPSEAVRLGGVWRGSSTSMATSIMFVEISPSPKV